MHIKVGKVAIYRFLQPPRGGLSLTLMTTTSDPNRFYWAAVARDEQVEWEALAAEPDNIDQEWVDDPAGLWLRPPAALAGPVVLAIHGGGFVGGPAASHRRMFGHLAAYLHGRPFGVAVLDARRSGIGGITVFGDPALVERFTLLERR